MKTMSINNEIFEITEPRKINKAWGGCIASEYQIYRFYDRPSQYKVFIWLDWLKWARNTEGIKVFEISGANGFKFTIKGLYEDEQGNLYNLLITREHNRAIKVNC